MSLRIILKTVLPILAVGAGIAVFVFLLRSKPRAQRSERPVTAVLVEVQQAETQNRAVVVEAQGTVIPARSVVVQPEVTGRIVWLSDEMVPGGRLRAGDRLFRIDARDYRTSLEQQGAQVSRAQLDLELEEGRQVIARREWELLGGEQPAGQGSARALREPQLRTAKVGVRAAESALKQAQLSLRRTTLTAPFNATVQTESVEVGQLVGPQSPLATLVGTDTYWIQVSIPLEQLSFVDVPGINATEGATAQVTQVVGDASIEREGRVVRLQGDLDPLGRMARLLVEVNDPLGLQSAADGRPSGLPLLIGAYVRVSIAGRQAANVIEIPRTALREGGLVYVMDREDRLRIRSVNVQWRNADSVFVSEGITAGERFITSRVSTPVDGMRVRTETAGDEAEGQDQPLPSSPRAEAR